MIDLSDLDKENLVSRMKDAMASELTEVCFSTIDEVAAYCESPIEVLLGTTFTICMRMVDRGDTFRLCTQEQEAETKTHLLLMPQYLWQGYRIDWSLKCPVMVQPYIFIECDGHDFHERTKEQAERDRSKDRAIQMAGIPVLRFTGREIYRNAGACCLQIIHMLNNLEMGRK